MPGGQAGGHHIALPTAPLRPREARALSFPATWRSGYAAACKAVYTGSIPVVAFEKRPYFGRFCLKASGPRGYFVPRGSSFGIGTTPNARRAQARTPGPSRVSGYVLVRVAEQLDGTQRLVVQDAGIGLCLRA